MAADPRPCAREPADEAAFYELAVRAPHGRWLGGDLPASIDLGDGRVLWLFGDTLVGALGGDGSLAPGTRYWHNTALVQVGGCVDFLDTGGPSWLAIPDTPDWWWPSGGYVRDDIVHVFVQRVTRTGPGVFDFRPVSAEMVRLRLADLGVIDATPLPHQERLWATSVVTRGRWAYLYGGTHAPGPDTFIARAPADDPRGPWRFWDGARWAPDPAVARPVLSHPPFNNPHMAVLPDGGFLAVAKDRELIGSDVIGWTAHAPQGPWRPLRAPLVTPPPPAPGSHTYMGVAHPAVALAGGAVLVSWNIGSLSTDVAAAHASGYGPRFDAIELPERSER